jgi:hypothetical protein
MIHHRPLINRLILLENDPQLLEAAAYVSESPGTKRKLNKDSDPSEFNNTAKQSQAVWRRAR